MEALPLLLQLGFYGAMAAVAIGAHALTRHVRAGALERLARALAPSGFALERGAARAIVDGQRVSVTLSGAAQPGEAPKRTRVAAEIRPPLDLGLQVGRGVGVPHGKRRFFLGDAAFDGAVAIFVDEPARAEALFGRRLSAALAGLERSSFRLAMSDGEIALETDGWVFDAARLGRAARGVARAAALVGETRGRVPAASHLLPFARAFAEYAKVQGFHFGQAPLCAWGEFDDVHVAVYPVAPRGGVSLYGYGPAIEVSASFRAPLGVDLLVSTAADIEAVGPRPRASFRDVPLGDPAFDARFVVHADDPEAARRLLDEPLRRELFELRAHAGPVQIRDEGVLIRAAGPGGFAVAPRLLAAATSIVHRIHDNLDAARPARGAAYR